MVKAYFIIYESQMWNLIYTIEIKNEKGPNATGGRYGLKHDKKEKHGSIKTGGITLCK